MCLCGTWVCAVCMRETTLITDGVQGFMGRFTEENIWKACLKETEAAWGTEHSYMLKHMEKCAAPIGFSRWSSRCWDLGNRISCCVIMWVWWGRVLRSAQSRALEEISRAPRMKCLSPSLCLRVWKFRAEILNKTSSHFHIRTWKKAQTEELCGIVESIRGSGICRRFN